MRRNLTLLAACATAAALSAISGAQAATTLTSGTAVTPANTYDLNPYFVKVGETSSAVKVKNVPNNTTQVDDFSFGLKNELDTTAFGSFGFNKMDTQSFTDANLELFSGTVGGASTFIAGIDYDPQTEPQQSFSSVLSPGNYFIQATVTTANVKGGGSSPFTLSATVHHISAAPEPSAWLLMMMGVGALGMGLRYQRRQGVVLAA